MYSTSFDEHKAKIIAESIKSTETIKGSVELGEFVELNQVDWTWPRDRKVEAVIHELKTVGFFLITNVPGYDEKDLLKWGKWFCD